jgi:hypothetical protein
MGCAATKTGEQVVKLTTDKRFIARVDAKRELFERNGQGHVFSEWERLNSA